MKESLAARQAALLKQNAELNERVEAIEQRHQQQQLVGATSVRDLRHSASGTRATAADEDEGDGDPYQNADDSDPLDATTVRRSTARGVGLKMDLSASIDSLGSALGPQEPLGGDGTQHTAAVASNNNSSSRPQSRQRSAKTLQHQESADTHQSSPSPDEKQRSGAAGRTSSRHTTVTSSGGTGAGGGGGSDSPDGLGLEATVRYQKARLRVLQDELDTANTHVKDLQASQGVLRSQVEDLKTENGVLTKKCQQTQQLLDKQRELSAAQDAKQRILETQLAAAQTRADEVQRAEKQATQQFRSKDVRLNRALEELEKLKTQLQDERRAHDKDAGVKSELEQLARENKRLEKHKSELLVAFKKQMKLIDLLKRQRIHMEAAKMLSFTEEEFSKTLELG